jgi:hypothetical protein
MVGAMRSSPTDLLVRIVSMVLAGLVSLSLIGAIHTATQGSGPERPGGFTVESAPTQPRTEPDGEQDSRVDAGNGIAGGGESSGGAIAVPAPPPGPAERSARWLEVIAYLLFALTGVAALVALGLWRAAGELRRAADAAETLAAREPVR